MASTRTTSLSLALLAPLVLTAAQDPETQEPETQEPEIEVLYGSTLWKKGKHGISGSYRIERRGEGDEREVTLILGDDFATKEGPDLKLVLSPLTVDEVKSKTALKDALVLGLLPSEKGASRFAVPAGTDLARFRSVLIHCEKYTILWGAAPLHGGEVVASGSQWVKKKNKVQGHWEIAKVGKRHVIRLGSDFKTKKGPDLKLVLSPLTIEQARDANALNGGRVLPLLESPKGAQEFEVPEGVDLSGFQSLLIHCEQYTKLWGGVALVRS